MKVTHDLYGDRQLVVSHKQGRFIITKTLPEGYAQDHIDLSWSEASLLFATLKLMGVQ